MTTRRTVLVVDDDVDLELARLIKRAVTRSWCATSPLTIARYLLAQGVTMPTTDKEASR